MPDMTPEEIGQAMRKEARVSALEILAKNNELLSELNQEIKKIADEFSGLYEEAFKEAQNQVEELENANAALKEQRKMGKKDYKSNTAQERALTILAKHFGRGGTGSRPKDVLGSGGIPGTTKTKTVVDVDLDGVKHGQEFANSFGSAATKTIKNVSLGLMGGASLYQLLTNDIVEGPYNYALGMKEIAYQTEGINQTMPGLQKAFRKVSDVFETTGFHASVFEKAYISALKKGVKGGQSIIKTGLSLGKVMGLTEEGATDIALTFADWSQKLGTNDIMIADIARSMRDVGRQTGIVGEELAMVAKRSEDVLKKMRDSGNLTAAAAKNVMLMQAEGQKLGLDMTKLLSGLTSGADLLLTASNETRRMLQMAAVHAEDGGNALRQLQMGTVLQSKSGLKSISDGMKNYFKSVSGGVELTEEAIQRMNVDQRRNLDLLLKNAFGVGLDEYRRQAEAIENSSKTLKERIAKARDIGPNATDEEKAKSEKQVKDMVLAESLSLSSNLHKYTERATGLEDAVVRMEKSLTAEQVKELRQSTSDVAGQFGLKELQTKVLAGDKTAMAEAMSLSAAKALKESSDGKYDFVAEMTDALQNKDLKKLRSLQEQMNEAEQKLAVKEKTALDVMTETAMIIGKINDYLRNIIGPAVISIATAVGTGGILLTMLLSSLAGGVFKVEIFKMLFNLLKGGGGWLGGLRKFGPKLSGSWWKSLKSLGPKLSGSWWQSLKGLGPKLSGSWWQSLKGLGPKLSGSWWQSLKGMGTKLIGSLRTLGPWLLNSLKTLGPWLWNSLKALGPWLWNSLKTLGPMLMNGLRALGPMLMNLVRALGPMLMSVLRAIGPMLMNILRFIGPMLLRLLPMLGTALVTLGGWIASALGAAVAAILSPIGLVVAAIAVVVGGLGLIAYKAWQAANEIDELNKLEEKRTVTIGKQLEASDAATKNILNTGTEMEKAELILARQGNLKAAEHNLKKSKEAEANIGWMGRLLGSKKGAAERVKQDEMVLKARKAELEEARKQTGILQVLTDPKGLRVTDAHGERLLEDVNTSLEEANKIEEKKDQTPKLEIPKPPEVKVEPPKAGELVPQIPAAGKDGVIQMEGGGRIIESPHEVHGMNVDEVGAAIGGSEYAKMKQRLLYTRGEDNGYVVPPKIPLAGTPHAIPALQPGALLPGGLGNTAEQMVANSVVGGIAMDTPVPTQPTPQPKSIVDVHEKMQREHAGTVAASKQKLGKDNELLATAQNQLDYLVLLHGDLEKVIDLLTPDKGSGKTAQETSRNRSNIKPRSASDYHEWQFAKYRHNAGTNVITDGT